MADDPGEDILCDIGPTQAEMGQMWSKMVADVLEDFSAVARAINVTDDQTWALALSEVMEFLSGGAACSQCDGGVLMKVRVQRCIVPILADKGGFMTF